MPISPIVNGESGQSVTDKLNTIIAFANASPPSVVLGKLQNGMQSTNATTLITLTELSIPVEADSWYQIDYQLFGTKAAANIKVGNINLIFGLPSGVISKKARIVISDSNVSYTSVGLMDVLSSNNSANTTAVDFSVEITALLYTGIYDGLVNLQFRQNAANGTATAITSGSVRSLKL